MRAHSSSSPYSSSSPPSSPPPAYQAAIAAADPPDHHHHHHYHSKRCTADSFMYGRHSNDWLFGGFSFREAIFHRGGGN